VSESLDLFAPIIAQPDRKPAKPAKRAAGMDHRLNELFSTAETARTAAWLAVQRGDWQEALEAAQRAAEGYQEVVARLDEVTGARGATGATGDAA